MNILIADDDYTTLKILERILVTGRDYSVQTAEDGQECWELFESGYRPDVCLLDIEMPHMSGLDVLEKMRETEELRSIPVIIITGRCDIDSQASAAALRSFAFIVKPFSPARVLSLVSEATVSTRKSFDPDGFEPRQQILNRHNINGTQYFKQMVYFVGMLSQRIEDLGTLVDKGKWRQVSEMLIPVTKLAQFIGATTFLALFKSIERSTSDKAVDAIPCAMQHYRRLRSEFDSLRHLLEARLNVVIKSGNSNRIVTVPCQMAESDLADIQLSANLEERQSKSVRGVPTVQQSIILKATRSEKELMTAVLELENGELVLRSTIGGPLNALKKRYDIALYPEKEFENGIRITRPRPVSGLAGK